MTEKWVLRETLKRERCRHEILNRIYESCLQYGIPQEQAELIKRYCDTARYESPCKEVFSAEIFNSPYNIDIEYWQAIRALEKPFMELNKNDTPQDRYLDSEMEFDGDIIITDPCYIARDGDWPGFYDHPSVKCMMRDTLYGDWGCTVYDLITGHKIGKFCADAGLVGVFLRDDVSEYNPKFEKEYADRSWCWALIENFKGTCKFVIRKVRYKYNGKWCYDFVLKVYGDGINKVTGEPIAFVGQQTSL